MNFSVTGIFAADNSNRVDSINVNDYSTDRSTRFSYNYDFESGPNPHDIFGDSTQTDISARNPELENIRRNKDAAYIPPVYGVFSGEIPTDASSPYHSNAEPNYAGSITNFINSTDTYNVSVPAFTESNGIAGILPSTSTIPTDYLITQAHFYEDGSIGTLKIPTLDLVVKVFEGETLDNMADGAGHFAFTSAWDGNIGIAAHNGGSAGYFEKLKDLAYGDEIIFTTFHGTRTYKVTDRAVIDDTDYSLLGYSAENRLTLITCQRGVPTKRLAVVAEMVN
ncbi:MAG: class D sortase [Cytophagaceae bacterium]|jgi:sortase A|nr:class D sortase [Cytophagaceae bacterium]